MSSKPHSKGWKDKIDPAFDRMIIAYVNFLDNCEELPKGYLSLIDVYEKLDLGNSWWNSADLKDNLPEDVNHVEKPSQEIVQDLLNIFNYTKKDKKEYFDICLKMAEGLPEESKAFYIKNIESFLEDPTIKPPFSLLSKPNEDNMALNSVIGSLFMRCIFIDTEETKEPDVSNDEIELFKRPEVMKFFIGFIYSLLSSIVYQKTPLSLLTEFLNGDDRALFKAVAIDKSLLCCKEVKERILKAQFSGDNKFFRGLGKAIASKQLSNVKGYGKLFPVLILFWSFGLYNLKHPELYDLLIQSKVISRQYSSDALEKFTQRYIRPYFKN